MKSEILVQLMTGVIMVIGALISTYLIPYLKSLTLSKKMENLVDFIFGCVRWANQTIPKEEFTRKKKEVTEVVIDYAKNKLNVDITEQQIDTLIEAAVNSVKVGK